MSNSYFQFKQFRIAQDRCAMKVSTDACIQGAWTPIAPYVSRVLDIGAGTGLLSLMLAQKNNTIHIDAVELDEAAALQAGENMAASPFAGRIEICNKDVREMNSGVYDMIICNPPFFSNSLLGGEDKRNVARHTLSFTQQDMLHALERLLSPQGYASVLLPAAGHQVWESLLATKGFYINKKLSVQPFGQVQPNRVVSICSRKDETCETNTLIIYKSPSVYTEDFKHLLRDFYLYL